MFKKYSQVEKLNFGFKNTLYSGYLGSQKVFIKQYVIREGREKEDNLKVQTELTCYENIRTLSLPKIIEANPKQHYLVLEWLDFQPFSSDQELVRTALRIWAHQLLQVEADFLPIINFAYYLDNLFRRLRELGSMGIVADIDKIVRRMTDFEPELTRGFQTFSHGDLYPGNLKLHGDKPILFDFEHAHRDSPFYDLACLRVHFFGTAEDQQLVEFTQEFSVHDQAMYEIMQLRRAIDVLYAFKNHQEMIDFSRAQELVSVLIQ